MTGRGEGLGGRSDTEKDFLFLPFRPGERGRMVVVEGWALRVEMEGPVRRVAREFCSVMG